MVISTGAAGDGRAATMAITVSDGVAGLYCERLLFLAFLHPFHQSWRRLGPALRRQFQRRTQDAPAHVKHYAAEPVDASVRARDLVGGGWPILELIRVEVGEAATVKTMQLKAINLTVPDR